jgi:hypothetical protein
LARKTELDHEGGPCRAQRCTHILHSRQRKAEARVSPSWQGRPAALPGVGSGDAISRRGRSGARRPGAGKCANSSSPARGREAGSTLRTRAGVGEARCCRVPRPRRQLYQAVRHARVARRIKAHLRSELVGFNIYGQHRQCLGHLDGERPPRTCCDTRAWSKSTGSRVRSRPTSRWHLSTTVILSTSARARCCTLALILGHVLHTHPMACQKRGPPMRLLQWRQRVLQLGTEQAGG